MGKTEETSYGVLVNSFYELEPNYADYFKNEMKKKAWLIGPVSLCNRNASDKVQRGQRIATDEQICLSWLDSREPNSVLYISFGTLARLHPKQLLEIAHGLEASGHSFIWVVGKLFESANGGEEEGGGVRENWLPSGFEERMKDKDRGLIIRGWAP
ncbi:UDP-glucuronosyl/UDP-glucosyltransferase [Trema orientale]|uniref:UDP-glucuronosyl/UDP-glucosyltransferase n=1 Tax=Trema orientale TaxID=63057 RepID=A0A2P5E933_TREOI|nr:UDP-glucuronosyl/UDP-glucosyltransferase [Trema orientale]